MFEKFFPDEYLGSTYKIPFEKLYEQGYRGVIFDIDNTLVPHGAPADRQSKKHDKIKMEKSKRIEKIRMIQADLQRGLPSQRMEK